jgi:hypothetical protein
MLNLLVFFILSFFITAVIMAATYFINLPSNDYEKHSAY